MIPGSFFFIFDINCQRKMSTESLGEKIRKLREEKEMPLRKVADFTEIDPAILSKIECGKRRATREQVIKLASFFKVKPDQLLITWISDKIAYELKDEALALKALQVAEEKVTYKAALKPDRQKIIQKIKQFFKKDGRVEKAWIFGSFARGDDHANSDIDLMVSYSSRATGTLLDYADIKFKLENLLHKKIDLVEEGFIKSFAVKNIDKDKQLIYG